MPKSIAYEKNHKNVNGIIFKKCNRHHIYFPDEDIWIPCTEEYFYKNNNKQDGLFPYCRRCNIAKTYKNQKEKHYEKQKQRVLIRNKTPEYKVKTRQLANQQRESGYQKKYRLEHPDKIRKYNQKHKNHKISKKEWESCKKYFNNCCAYCGMSEEEHKSLYNQDLHKDHAYENGIDDLSNCLPACKHCNSRKWKHLLEDWYCESNPVFNSERFDRIQSWLNKDYKQYENTI